jgi:hypothetical protein
MSIYYYTGESQGLALAWLALVVTSVFSLGGGSGDSLGEAGSNCWGRLGGHDSGREGTPATAAIFNMYNLQIVNPHMKLWR